MWATEMMSRILVGGSLIGGVVGFHAHEYPYYYDILTFIHMISIMLLICDKLHLFTGLASSPLYLLGTPIAEGPGEPLEQLPGEE